MKNLRGRCRGYGRNTALASVMIVGMVAVKANATEFAYGFGYFGDHSDNINRTPTDTRSEWISSYVAGLAYRENTPELVASIAGQAQFDDYHKDTFDDSTQYFLDAIGIWTILPRALTWTVADHYTQAKRNPAAPDTPDNRVGTNIFDTGPDVSLRLGPANTLVLGGRYGELYFDDDSGNDNDRLTGYTRWLHGLNAETTLSANVEVMDVDFKQDSVANRDYRLYEVFLGLESRQARSSYTLDLGVTKLERDNTEDSEGPLFRLGWARELTSQSRFGLTAASEYGDAGTLLLSTLVDPSLPPGTPTTPNADDIATPDVYYVKRLEAFYNYAGTDWAWDLQLFDRKFDYEVTPQDRQEYGTTLRVTFDPAGVLTTTVYVDALHTKYLNVSREDGDLTYGVRWLYRATRTLGMSLECYEASRNSTNEAAEYTDRRVLVGIFYNSGPLYLPSRR